ncbi:MAG: 2-hydroxychromene-2-carboxylate isomerase [Burkholderiales bacterium]|nr:2-hydroxychromene-2-carboxylate isomerase [Burkholderiales bacterium]
MARIVVDYYFAPQSPWTYLGHARFQAIAARSGAAIRVRPVDLGKIFPLTGGLPLPQRAPARQAYRLVELKRWADALGLPLHLHPSFFPVPGDAAARLILAVDAAHGSDVAMDLSGRVLRAVWAEQRNINDAATLAALLSEAGLPVDALAVAGTPPVQQRYEEATQQALQAGVFGAPSYVVDGELFWGQDRLDFLERRLQA